MKKFLITLVLMGSICQTAFAAHQYRVVFSDGKSSISEQYITEGQSAEEPNKPRLDNKTFEKWDVDFSKIKSDTVVTAVYKEDSNKNNGSISSAYTNSTKENSQKMLDTDKPSNSKAEDKIEKSKTETADKTVKEKEVSNTKTEEDSKDTKNIKSNYVKDPDSKSKLDTEESNKRIVEAQAEKEKSNKIAIYSVVFGVISIFLIGLGYFIIKR